MKNIKRFIERIYFTYIFNTKSKKKYIIIPMLLISISSSWLYGYKFRDNKITDLNLTINDLTFNNDSIHYVNDSLLFDLIELDSLKQDGDYYRYLAFKHGKILIPEKINKDDIMLIHKMSKKYSIPLKYIYRLIWQESKYNPNAKSHMGANGYMQVMPKTFTAIKKRYVTKNGNIDHLDKNKQNILIGTFYIDYLYKKYKRWDLTFAAYNAGPGNVQLAGNNIPNISETIHYVKFIMKN
jgi:hypothetical protein